MANLKQMAHRPMKPQSPNTSSPVLCVLPPVEVKDPLAPSTGSTRKCEAQVKSLLQIRGFKSPNSRWGVVNPFSLRLCSSLSSGICFKGWNEIWTVFAEVRRTCLNKGLNLQDPIIILQRMPHHLCCEWCFGLSHLFYMWSISADRWSNPIDIKSWTSNVKNHSKVLHLQ